ncbi:MAG: hypothetical protein VKJ04_09600 [Vampirovibrionales bacterium]|nr:hypothetical protein [Vampirovibrionales bacterium]
MAASQARLLMLTARKSDIELQLQFINQARAQMANAVSGLFGRGLNLEPESQESKTIAAATSQLQQQDKIMEMNAKRLETQHQAVQTELDGVQKVIQKNIATTFNTFNHQG